MFYRGVAKMGAVSIRAKAQGGNEVSAGTHEPLTHGQVLVSLLVSLIVSFLG
jgi:hypothetical protein